MSPYDFVQCLAMKQNRDVEFRFEKIGKLVEWRFLEMEIQFFSQGGLDLFVSEQIDGRERRNGPTTWRLSLCVTGHTERP